MALALEQERRVTEQINALAGCARDEGDYTSEQFMQWFIKEQVEEVATMSDLLRVVERSRDDVMEVENYMAREHSGSEGRTRPPRAPRAPDRRRVLEAASLDDPRRLCHHQSRDRPARLTSIHRRALRRPLVRACARPRFTPLNWSSS